MNPGRVGLFFHQHVQAHFVTHTTLCLLVMEKISGHIIKMTSNYNDNVYNDWGFTSMCLYASVISHLETRAVLPLPYMGISTIGIPSFFLWFKELKQYFPIICWIKFIVYLQNIYVLHLFTYLNYSILTWCETLTLPHACYWLIREDSL